MWKKGVVALNKIRKRETRKLKKENGKRKSKNRVHVAWRCWSCICRRRSAQLPEKEEAPLTFLFLSKSPPVPCLNYVSGFLLPFSPITVGSPFSLHIAGLDLGWPKIRYENCVKTGANKFVEKYTPLDS